jgi:hypothetical protein
MFSLSGLYGKDTLAWQIVLKKLLFPLSLSLSNVFFATFAIKSLEFISISYIWIGLQTCFDQAGRHSFEVAVRH